MSKPVSFSKTVSTHIVQPADLNSLGHLFGGTMVSIMDKTAAIAAIKHCGGPVVTLAIDSLVFRKPVPSGAILTLRASVNRVFRHSLEVGVAACILPMGAEVETKVCGAYFTFVAIDAAGNQVEVPDLVTETEEERRRHAHAGMRREARLKLKTHLGGGA